MKKVSALTVVVICLFLALGSINFVSCAVEEALNEYTCETSDVGYGDFETCCNTTDCYYLYNDKKYECDGQDCEDAATEMAKDMIANSKKSANIDECEIDVEELTNKILQRN